MLLTPFLGGTSYVRAVHAHTRSLILSLPGLRALSYASMWCNVSCVRGSREVGRGKKRARARLKILVSSSRAKGNGEARNREGIVVFKNFGQNLWAPDGRLGVSLLLSFGASDIVNGADTAEMSDGPIVSSGLTPEFFPRSSHAMIARSEGPYTSVLNAEYEDKLKTRVTTWDLRGYISKRIKSVML